MSRALLPIKPEYIDKIFNGTKKFEYRKTLCKRPIDTIIIYSTRPVMRIVGEMQITGVINDTPDIVWQKTKEFSGITKQFFDKYYSDKSKTIAYEIGKITRYNKPLKLSEFGLAHTPQSFVYIK